jgi:hypothetical protein
VRPAGATPLSEADEPTQRECHLSVKLPRTLYKALVAMAAADERSVAGQIRWMVRQRAEEAGLLSMWEE